MSIPQRAHARKPIRTLSALAVGAALAAFGAAVQAQESLKVEISGQVNRALMGVDDGGASDSFHVDNDNSSTRFRFVGSADVSPGLKAGILWEVEYQSNPSNLVTFATRDVGSPTLDERHIDIFFQSGWGKLSFGQGDGAANGAVEVDLSGTSVAHYAGVTDIGGAFQFRTSAGALTGPSIGASTSQQDFESRYDRVRYDTPTFAGFGVAASFGAKDTNRDVKEIALRYSGELGGLGRLAGALGYSNEDGSATVIDDKTVGGSLSWLHGSGFNLTLGHTQRDLPGRDGKFTYGKVGYKFGRHAVSLDYAKADDQAAAGDEADMVGLAYVFTPVSWAEIYALAKRHMLDRPGTSFQDIDFLMIGTRLRF